jgi:hypothetical protein
VPCPAAFPLVVRPLPRFPMGPPALPSLPVLTRESVYALTKRVDGRNAGGIHEGEGVIRDPANPNAGNGSRGRVLH